MMSPGMFGGMSPQQAKSAVVNQGGRNGPPGLLDKYQKGQFPGGLSAGPASQTGGGQPYNGPLQPPQQMTMEQMQQQRVAREQAMGGNAPPQQMQTQITPPGMPQPQPMYGGGQPGMQPMNAPGQPQMNGGGGNGPQMQNQQIPNIQQHLQELQSLQGTPGFAQKQAELQQLQQGMLQPMYGGGQPGMQPMAPPPPQFTPEQRAARTAQARQQALSRAQGARQSNDRMNQQDLRPVMPGQRR